jgi:hypothetical protein
VSSSQNDLRITFRVTASPETSKNHDLINPAFVFLGPFAPGNS